MSCAANAACRSAAARPGEGSGASSGSAGLEPMPARSYVQTWLVALSRPVELADRLEDYLGSLRR